MARARSAIVTVVTSSTLGAARGAAAVVHRPGFPADGTQAAMIEHINRLTVYDRTPTAKQLGERLRVTNAEHELLKLWQILPVDVSDDELVEQRKAKKRECAARRRLESGIRTRAAYLAKSLTRLKPWEAECISRRTWERRRRKRDAIRVR